MNDIYSKWVLKPTTMNIFDLNIKPAKKPRVDKIGAHEIPPLAESFWQMVAGQDKISHFHDFSSR